MPEKVCVICGRDCANVPRQKDPQGRYACKSCLDARAIAPSRAKDLLVAPPPKQAPGTPPVDPDANVGYELLGDIPEPCATCGAPLAKGIVVCTRCGYNAQTGERITTAVIASPAGPKSKPEVEDQEEEDDDEPRTPLVIHGGWAAGAIATVMAILFVVAKTSDSDLMIGVYSLGVIGVSIIAAISSIIIPFQEEEAAWGLGLLLANGLVIARAIGLLGGYGFGGMFGVGATLYYAFAVSESRWLRGILVINFVCIVSLIAFTGK